MSEYIIITTTTNSKSNAQSIANLLIKKKLAACVQIIPDIESTFEWKGSVNREKEILILVKTTKMLKEDVNKKIKENHSYKIPQITSLEFDILNNEYKEWFDLSVGGNIE